MIQTTNIRRILDRVMRHPMMRNIPLETAIEYTVDFISLLGTPALYEEKCALVRIKDWRGALPCDFVNMIQVRNAPYRNYTTAPIIKGAVYRYATGSFHMSPDKIPFNDHTYKLQGMCIYPTLRDGMLEIAYHAFAVDDEGCPLLPDNTSFLRGLENYIKVQWFTILFDTGKIQANVLQNAQQQYAWAVGDAQSEFSRLSLDQAESLFNSLKMLLPRKYEHERGFITNGVKEQLGMGIFGEGGNAILSHIKEHTINSTTEMATKVITASCEAGPDVTSLTVNLPSTKYIYIGAFTLLDGEIADSEIIRDGDVVTARWQNVPRGTITLNVLYKA